MKNFFFLIFALLAMAVFAGVDDMLVTFSTPGPDKYADGKTVLDGECYALVWTKDAVKTTVLTAPVAKDGRCPKVLFQLDVEVADNYKNGEWSVELLDTRDFAKDETGMTLSGINEKGAAKTVNATASVSSSVAASGQKIAGAAAAKAVVPGAFDLVGAGVPDPVIKSIRVVGANVQITVGNTVPFVGYTVASGDGINSISVPKDAVGQNGKSGEDITIIMEKKTGDAGFFRVSAIQ